jgi:hypothetical protein
VNGLIDCLYTRLGTISSYSANVNLHNSQITIAPANIFQPAVSSPAVPWQRLLTLEVFQLQALRSFLHSIPFRTQPQLTLSLAYNISARTTQKHLISIDVAQLRHCPATRGCLPSHCPEMVAVYSHRLATGL